MDEVEREWLAASVLLGAGVTDGDVCAVHLRAAWRALAAIIADRRGVELGDDVAAFFRAHAPELFAGRETLDEVAALFAEKAPSVPLLRSQLELLESWIPTMGGKVPTAPRWRVDREVWRRRAGAAVVGSVVLLALYVALTPSPRWRVEFHGGVRLDDPLVVTEERQGPNYDWGPTSPRPGVPKDGFSARFSACVPVPTDAVLSVSVESDDGSRVLLDGRPILDNWGRHGARTVTGTSAVASGVHLLTVEYFDAAASALLRFEATVDGVAIGELDLAPPLERDGALGCAGDDP